MAKLLAGLSMCWHASSHDVSRGCVMLLSQAVYTTMLNAACDGLLACMSCMPLCRQVLTMSARRARRFKDQPLAMSMNRGYTSQEGEMPQGSIAARGPAGGKQYSGIELAPSPGTSQKPPAFSVF